MHTKVQSNTEKNFAVQAVKSKKDEAAQSSENKGIRSESSDDFSEIMDKIAARFNDNLGFDFTSLLGGLQAGSVPVAAPPRNIEIIRKETRSEEKSSKPEQRAEAKPSVDESEKTHIEGRKEKQGEQQVSSSSGEVKKEVQKEVRAESETTKKERAKEHKSADASQVSAKEKSYGELTQKDLQLKEVPVESQQYSAEQASEVEQTEAPSEVSSAKVKVDKSKAVMKEVSSGKEAAPVDGDTAVEAATDVINAVSDVPTQEAEQTPKINGLEKAITKGASSGLKEQILSALLSGQFGNAKEFAAEHVQTAKPVMSAIDSIKGMGDLIKDKMLSLGQNNQNAGANSLSQTGLLQGKNAGEKPEALREKLFLQQPQMFKALEKVESALKEAAKSKDGKTISLRLDPPSLGSVKVDVSLKDGSLHARINVDSQTVNNMLREHAHDLQLALRKLGLNVDKVTVAINHHSQDSFAGSDSSYNQSSGNKTGHEQNSSQLRESIGGEAFDGSIAESMENITLDHWVA